MHKLNLYRIKAESPRLACEKINSILNPHTETELSSEEQIIVARVITILSETDSVFRKKPYSGGLYFLNLNEEGNYGFFKETLKLIDKETRSNEFKNKFEPDWRNATFSFIGVNGSILDLIIDYFDKEYPNLEDIIYNYMNLSKPTKRTIEDIRKTDFFKDEFDGNIFNCIFQTFDIESSSGLSDEMADKLNEINCSESADEICYMRSDVDDDYFSDGFDQPTVLGCLSEDNVGYLYGDHKLNLRWDPCTFTIEDLNKIFRTEIENFDILKDEYWKDDDDDDGLFQVQGLDSIEEKGKIYIVFSDYKMY